MLANNPPEDGFEGADLKGKRGSGARGSGAGVGGGGPSFVIGVGCPDQESMLGILILVLDGATAPVPLGVETCQHFQPGGTTFGVAFRPGVPAGLLDEPMYVFCDAVGKAVAEAVGLKGSDVDDVSDVCGAF